MLSVPAAVGTGWARAAALPGHWVPLLLAASGSVLLFQLLLGLDIGLAGGQAYHR